MLTIIPEQLNLRDGNCVLDLGCGEGRHSLGLFFQQSSDACPHALHIVGLDMKLSDLQTAAARKNDFPPQLAASNQLTFMQGDGLCLPFQNASIDCLICSEVLEHIDNYQAMLKEIVRVLKPGGTLAVSVPRAWPERICWWLEEKYHRVEGGHVRIFNASALKKTICKSGLHCFNQHGAHAIHVPYWWLRCLFWRRGENFWPLRWYHKFLVWDLFKAPALTRILDKLLNPFMGKSVVFYFIKSP